MPGLALIFVTLLESLLADSYDQRDISTSAVKEIADIVQIACYTTSKLASLDLIL